MLSLVVNDALEGVDITRRYPTFYRRMLADPELRWAFLEALEILGNSQAGELDPLPDDLDVDLSFLEQAQPPPTTCACRSSSRPRRPKRCRPP